MDRLDTGRIPTTPGGATAERPRGRFALFHRVGLRTALAIGFSVVIALTLLVALVSVLAQQRSIGAVNRLLEVDGRIAALSLGSNVALLNARRAEKDFLLFRTDFGFDEARSRYVTLFRISLAEIRQNMSEIRALEIEAQTIDLTRSIEQAVARYEAGFTKIVGLYGALGHVGTGFEGKLREKAHGIERIVEALGDDRLMVGLLALRRSEKDFIARGLDKNVEAFAKSVVRFDTDVASARVPAEVRRELRRLTDEYREFFGRYVETEARIDAESEVYLVAAHTVEPGLEKLLVDARRNETATRDQAERLAQAAVWTISAAALLAILVSLGVAGLVARAITRSVHECVVFARKVAQGDFASRMEPKGGHEFGALAFSLNEMTAALQEREAGLQRAGGQLLASEDRYRDLVENSLDLVCTHDLEGNLLSVNETGVRLSGYSREALLGMNLADLLAPAVRDSFSAYLDEIQRKGVASGLMRVQTATGEQRWWEYSNTLRTEGVAVPIVRGTSHDVTERMHAETALHESEVKLRAIFENAVEGIFLVDAEGRVVSANPMLARMLGYESPEQMGREIRSVAHDVYAEKGARGRFRALLNTAHVVEDFETQWRRKDGSTFWVSLSGRVIKRETRGAIHHLGMARDITERRRVDAELRKLALAVRQSGTGIVITDPAGAIEFVNPRFEAMTGYSAAEVLGKTPRLLKSGLHSQEFYRDLWQTITAGKEWAGELQNRKKSGELYFEYQHISPVLDERGAIQHFVAVKDDITQRKWAEIALHESESKHRRIYESLQDAYVETTMDGIVQEVSSQIGPLTRGQYKREDFLGKPASLFYADARQREAFLHALATNGRVLDFELTFRNRDGSLIPASISAKVMLDAQGRPERIASVMRDISDRKEAENRIKRLNRVYAVLSGINALIVRAGDRIELFREVCRVAVEHGGFPMVWIGEVDREAMRVKPVAWHGTDERFLGQIRMTVNEGAPGGIGVVGRAVRDRVPVISQDIENDPQVAAKGSMERGARSLAVLPLVVAGEAVGVLHLYSDVPGFFDVDEMKLLTELSGDISFALDHLDKAKKLDYLAYYDPLTGLANRSLFLERLSQFLSGSKHSQGKLALVVADIERLKIINDSLGRQAGDELLRQFAKRLAGVAEPAHIARVSADQFAVILPEVRGKSDVARQVEEIACKCFAQPYQVNGTEVRISARSGVALYPNHAGDTETLLRNAEAALRKAKDTGDRHAFYTSDLTAGALKAMTLESKLRQALERDEFVLHYQPKLDLASGRIAGVEALIRWSSPDLGLVPPSEFVPLLESTGLIHEAGAWALKKAADDHLRWQRQGLAAPRIAVNVSAMQLRRSDFVATVKEAIAHGAKPVGIDLELTESLVMRDVEGNIEKLTRVRDLGLNVAIDDFGTGYSSLGYLAKLPVQALKIDRSFIITMLNDPNTMTLVSTMISLAHSLRLKVVAEGVDSEEQAKFLRLLRCDEMQGYLFSKPLPFEQMTALLQKEAQPAEEAFA